MNTVNEKYSGFTFGLLFLSMISFPPMTIYIIIKMVINSNVDYLDNYLSVKKCAKCFLWIPGILTIISLFSIGESEFGSIVNAILFLWVYYGVFAVIFFVRASKMKEYNRYYEELYANAATNNSSLQKDSIDNNPVDDYLYEEEVNVDYKVVICNSCGAKKQIVIGRRDKCDYCDSPLEA